MNKITKLHNANSNLKFRLQRVSHDYIDADSQLQILKKIDERGPYLVKKMQLETERDYLIGHIRENNEKINELCIALGTKLHAAAK